MKFTAKGFLVNKYGAFDHHKIKDEMHPNMEEYAQYIIDNQPKKLSKKKRRKLAEKKLRQIANRRNKEDGNWKADWLDSYQHKHCIYYDYIQKCFRINLKSNSKNLGAIYFSKMNDLILMEIEKEMGDQIKDLLL